MSAALSRLRALALVALVVPVAALGQAWPTKPVRLVSPSRRAAARMRSRARSPRIFRSS